MKNRLCTSDEMLARYLCNKLSTKERESVERHLAECNDCLQLLSETYDLTKKSAFIKHLSLLIPFLKKHKYTLFTLLSLSLSFIYSKYFFQFLVVSGLLGIKSIVEARTTKMLIMIQESIKEENKDIHDVIKK